MWVRPTKKEAIKKYLSEPNKCHLQQMTKEGSPPSRQYFQDLLNNYGNSEVAENILEGEITTELDAFPEVLRKWLLLMRRTESNHTVKDSIDSIVETEDFQQSFHDAKENTSSSPSG